MTGGPWEAARASRREPGAGLDAAMDSAMNRIPCPRTERLETDVIHPSGGSPGLRGQFEAVTYTKGIVVC